MKMTPYINLPGNAEDAMTFYQSVFGGKTEIMRWGEMPPDPKMPVSEALQNKVMHGSLNINEDVSIYFTDSMQIAEHSPNNNVYIHVEFDSEDELRSAFAVLSQGGTINMPLEETFWGSVYGDLFDKFGVFWGLHFQLPQKEPA